MAVREPVRSQVSDTGEGAQAQQPSFGRGRRGAVRVFALLGLLALNFLTVLVITEAARGADPERALEPPGSIEAQIGAEHPGEAVHLTGALAVLSLGAFGLAGLVLRPERAGSATHAAGAAAAWLVASGVVGDPDNYGGQAGPFDPVFLIMAVPALVAVALAVPWREWRRGGVRRPRLLLLAAAGLPWLWYGIDQAMMQRNTWPPLADPHHQSHWFTMALVGFGLVIIVAGASLSGRGWRTATTTAGIAAAGIGVTSLLASDAASALPPALAVGAALWGLATLVVTWQESRRPGPVAS
jgi:hypothetical protein